MKPVPMLLAVLLCTRVLMGCTLITPPEAEDGALSDLITPSEIRAAVYPSGDSVEYGLYWYGDHGAYQKFVPGTSNPYYDASKPVVILFHGWNDTLVSTGRQWGTYFSDADTWIEEGWRAKGWNVGIYHWEQWADEDDVLWAEAKIYTRNGPKGFRYILPNGTYSTAKNPSGTGGVAELAYNDIRTALSTHKSSEIRFVGHSLGSQLATRTAELFYTNIKSGAISGTTYKINRLALMDPAWTKDGKTWWDGDKDLNDDGKNDWVGERSRWAIFNMMAYWSDFAVELYNTTALGEALGLAMDNNEALRAKVCLVSLRPWYYGSTQVKEKHNSAFYTYMMSMASNPPPECTVNWLNQRKLTGKDAASAATSTSRILEMMKSSYQWDQVEGRYSFTTSDDWFQRKNR